MLRTHAKFSLIGSSDSEFQTQGNKKGSLKQRGSLNTESSPRRGTTSAVAVISPPTTGVSRNPTDLAISTGAKETIAHTTQLELWKIDFCFGSLSLFWAQAVITSTSIF